MYYTLDIVDSLCITRHPASVILSRRHLFRACTKLSNTVMKHGKLGVELELDGGGEWLSSSDIGDDHGDLGR